VNIADIYDVFQAQPEAIIIEHLRTLPRRQKTALTNRLAGKSYREIADEMIISYDSAKTHVRLSLNKFVIARGIKISEEI